MKVSEVSKLQVMDRFLYWIKERHNVYINRQHGVPKPWTDDEVIQTTFFTNPYREDDKVTKWYAEHVREPLDMWSHEGSYTPVVFGTIAFRWFNWPATGTALIHGYSIGSLLQNWHCGRAIALLKHIQSSGHKIFSGAYNISNGGSTKPKINRVCEDYIQPVWDKRLEICNGIRHKSLANAHMILSTLPGLGGSGFMAAQIIADLKYSSVLHEAVDWWTWCSPGPGSKRGLARILGHNVTNHKEFMKEVNSLRDKVNSTLVDMPMFCAQDIQNCCCEFDKYERVRLGEGKSKRNYQGV